MLLEGMEEAMASFLQNNELGFIASEKDGTKSRMEQRSNDNFFEKAFISPKRGVCSCVALLVSVQPGEICGLMSILNIPPHIHKLV